MNLEAIDFSVISVTIASLILSYPILLAAVAVYWWHKPRQEDDSTPAGELLAIGVRLAVVNFGFAVFAYFTAIPAYLVYGYLLVGLLVVPVAQGAMILLPITGPALLLLALVVGIPDPEREIVDDPLPEPEYDPVQAYVDRAVRLTSPLRPSGEIHLDGHDYTAISENGQWIDAGTWVTIRKCHGDRLIVRAILD
jgi:hypothetical protein